MLPARVVERAPVACDDSECESRTRLFDVSVGLVEDLGRRAARRDKSPEAFCSVFQVCLPYRGVFAWHVGGEDVIGDANQVLFVAGNESYRMSNPFPDGYGELIVTPRVDVLAELARMHGTPLSRHPLFRQRRARASRRIQLLRARFLHWARHAMVVDELRAEEVVLRILRATFDDTSAPATTCGAVTARLIRRTKVFLEAELGNRILLEDIGRAVGASPTYLTDLFRRVEGTSLHRYLTQLRLARALLELPHANDLTTVALEVGFSSHSHFSAAFRNAFGCTPSEYRRGANGAHSRRAGAAPRRERHPTRACRISHPRC